jgi:cruciform cutting endonuclease 1
VLIERQRFRTGGAAAIFEWTLRVNTLEAMLHAGFAALNLGGGVEGERDGEGDAGGGLWRGRVDSVLPRAVVGFMFPSGEGRGGDHGEGVGGEGEDAEGKGKGKGKKKVGSGAAYQVLKRGKVDVLGGLLGDKGGLVRPDKGQAGEMARLFLAALEKRGQKGGRRKKGVDGEGGEVEELVTKMDDLSDAVLQGMVWLQWQRNLEALIKDRPELLLEVEEDDL